MIDYFNALRMAGIHGTFIAFSDSLHIITPGINWLPPKAANDNG